MEGNAHHVVPVENTDLDATLEVPDNTGSFLELGGTAPPVTPTSGGTPTASGPLTRGPGTGADPPRGVGSGGQHLARQDRAAPKTTGTSGETRQQGVFSRLRGDRGRAGRSERTPERTVAGSGHRTTKAGHEEGPRAFRGPGPFNGEYQNTPSLLLVPAGTGQDWLPLETTSPARPGGGRPESITTFQGGTDSPRIVVSPRVRTRPPPATSSASGPHHSGGGAPHRCYRRPRVWDVLALLPQAAKPSREKASSGPEPALTSWTPDLESVSSPSLLRTACGSCG